MNETAAFLQAIRQRPHDDAPRLIFADWLEERGDPRGEFIRLQAVLQIRLRQIDRRPRRRRRRNRAGVAAAARRALGRAAGAAGDSLGVSGEDCCTCGRTAITSCGQDWADLAASEVWEWVETVAFRTPGRQYTEALFASPVLSHIEALDLSRNQLGNEGAALLADSPHLGRLQALDPEPSTRIGWRGAGRLAASPLLQRLVALKLDDNHLGYLDDGVRALLSSPAPMGLTTLSLRWNTIGPAGARMLAESPALPHLTALHLGNNAVGDEGRWQLAKAAGLNQLTELRLEYNGVGAAAAAALRRRFGDGVHL